MSHRRQPLILLLLASAAVLGVALAFQYLGGLRPCVLCLYQRYPYGVVIALAALALALAEFLDRRVLAGFLGAAALALAIGAGIAVFHVGVEQHWWAGTAACGVTETANSIEALKAQILGTAPVRCDEVAWSLFGISMAGYNVVVSLALASFATQAALQVWQEKST